MSTSLSPNSHGTEPTSFQPLKDATDEQLIEGIKRLCVCHFNELVTRYTRHFCYIARLQMSKPYEDPEAIVNNAFFSLWTSAENCTLDRISTRTQFFAMMRIRIKNEIINVVEYFSALKRGKDRKRISFDYVQEVTPDDHEPGGNSDYFGEVIILVHSLLNELADKKYGDIFMLRMQGVPFMEISSQIGIAETTVRDRLKKAKSWLTENADQLRTRVPVH